MLAQTLLLVASAAVASAQISFNGSNIICPASAPNGNFCAGDSLSTNIIIRCVNGVAQPGNCNDNLAGEPPVGVQPAQCFQTSPTTGDAACAKNCIVYGTTQTTLPNCTPTFTASSSSSTSSSTSTSSPTTSPSTSTTTTSTGTTVITTGSTTLTKTFTTTFCPTTSATTTGPGTGSGTGSPAPPNNGTQTTTTGGNGGGNPTNTPSSPTTSASGFTGAAAATLSPMGLLAGAGLAVAYFL